MEVLLRHVFMSFIRRLSLEIYTQDMVFYFPLCLALPLDGSLYYDDFFK